MSWVRMDDKFYANPKVIQAWQRNGCSIGLYMMALTYAAQHETNGLVDQYLVKMLIPSDEVRAEVVSVLIDCGLWNAHDNDYMINDYFEYNLSKKELAAMRQKKKLAGQKGGITSKR